MRERFAATAIMGLLAMAGLSADQKPAPGKTITHELTVTTDQIYKGTLDLAIDAGKVSGKMKITSPTEITGDVAGTSKAGELSLDFPYHLTENNCDGNVKLSIKLAEKTGPSPGTMEATGCDIEGKLAGTVEIKPVDAKK